MVATKQTYTAAPTWTASGLANVFRTAFIDAGLMADWFDAFVDAGVENRIMELTYDAGATYGKSYLWWKFTTAGPHARLATGWNAATNQPVGTALENFFNTTTTLSGDERLTYLYGNTVSASSSYALTRFTSGDVSWFRIEHQTYRMGFCIPKPGVQLLPIAAALINDAAVNPLITANNDSTAIHFAHGPCVRRSMYSSSSSSLGSAHQFNRPDMFPKAYSFGGSAQFQSLSSTGTMPAPTGARFVLYSLPMNGLCDLSSADFGVLSTPNIATAAGDTFIVNETEVWESVHNNSIASTNSLNLVARTA